MYPSPMGAMDPREVYKHRSLLRKSAPFYFSHDGKTVKDGLPLSFVLEPDEWRRAKRKNNNQCRLLQAPPAEGSTRRSCCPQKNVGVLGGLLLLKYSGKPIQELIRKWNTFMT